MEAAKRRALTGSLLSLIPGLGHFYFGRRMKGLSLLLIFTALCAGFFFSELWAIRLLMLIVYVMVVGSSVGDMKCLAGLASKRPSEDSRGYIAFLLLTTGINALPLLWSGRVYGRLGKILWTLAMPVLAVLFFGGLYLIAS